MSLFGPRETERIAETVAAVERTSSVEILVAVMPRSAGYGARRIAFATAVGAAGGLALHLFAPTLGTDRVLSAQLVIGLLAYLATALPPVLRLVVGRQGLAQAVSERAVLCFAEQGVFDTRNRSGVLLFVSELERRTVILGDRAIDTVIGREGWKRLVDDLTRSLAEDHGADGVCRVVTALGEAIGPRFPRSADDLDELPNVFMLDPGRPPRDRV